MAVRTWSMFWIWWEFVGFAGGAGTGWNVRETARAGLEAEDRERGEGRDDEQGGQRATARRGAGGHGWTPSEE